MRLWRIVGATLLAAAHVGVAHGGRAGPHRVGLILHDNVLVRAQPTSSARVLAVLFQETQVAVVSRHGHWTHVRIWDSIGGWVPSREVVFRKPWSTVSTYRAPAITYHVHAYAPMPLRVAAVLTSGRRARSRPWGPITGWLAVGQSIVVTAWQQDAEGDIWYRTGSSWVEGDAVEFGAVARTGRSAGHLAWKAVSGKGMWLTLGTIAETDPNVIVRAARADGITHLYLESAISPLGFHGRSAVGPLLDTAHRNHLKVIAWVYPYLYDLAGDVALTRQVAAFRTRTGTAFDGIAADLERNFTPAAVRGYSQLVRAYLGPHYLLVGVTYPPQSDPVYPFREVARQYDVIAPMDYWHQTRTAYGLNYGHMRYGYAYSYRYAVDSVSEIRAQVSSIPIAPIGQTFDNYSRLGIGPLAPSGEEERGFIAGSKAAGAIGVSFFQWMTAQEGEWRAIHDARGF